MIGINAGLYFLNTALVEFQIPYLGKQFDPFPFADLKELFGVEITRIVYINMIVWHFRWTSLYWLLWKISTDWTVKYLFLVLFGFSLFNFAEYFFNYGQSPWQARIVVLIVGISAIIWIGLIKKK